MEVDAANAPIPDLDDDAPHPDASGSGGPPQPLPQLPDAIEGLVAQMAIGSRPLVQPRSDDFINEQYIEDNTKLASRHGHLYTVPKRTWHNAHQQERDFNKFNDDVGFVQSVHFGDVFRKRWMILHFSNVEVCQSLYHQLALHCDMLAVGIVQVGDGSQVATALFHRNSATRLNLEGIHVVKWYSPNLKARKNVDDIVMQCILAWLKMQSRAWSYRHHAIIVSCCGCCCCVLRIL